MARVRYIVDDVEEAVAFYVSNLSFEIENNFAPAVFWVIPNDANHLH